MNHRALIQQAVTALEWVNDNTADEMPIVDEALFDLRDELAKPDDQGIRDLEEAEQYIQQSIDNAPEPLKRLGEWLTKVLDENQWPHAERLLLGAIAAKPAAVPARVVASLQKKADDYYCASLDKARQPECLGWETKVKDGTFGAREMFAHGERNNLDGRHRGIYEALRMLAASPPTPAPAVSPVDVEADLGLATVWHEGSQSFYDAKLLRKMSREEVCREELAACGENPDNKGEHQCKE